MAAQESVIPDSEIFSFVARELHGILNSWTDQAPRSIAVHRYPKRDGGETEDMGRPERRMQVTLLFVGDNFRADYTAMLAEFDAAGDGLLVHPLHGQMWATWGGIDSATINVDQASNLLTVRATFIENQLDKSTEASPAGVAEAQQDVQVEVDDLLLEVAGFATAEVEANLFTGAAITYSSAAGAAYFGSTTDTTTDALLGAVTDGYDAFVAALALDPNALDDATTFDCIAAAERLHCACLDLDDAIRAAQPVIEEVTIPDTIHVAALCAARYGTKDVDTRVEQVLGLNPTLDRASAIPAGTLLELPRATTT